jgi:hypothetical protein
MRPALRSLRAQRDADPDAGATSIRRHFEITSLHRCLSSLLFAGPHNDIHSSTDLRLDRSIAGIVIEGSTASASAHPCADRCHEAKGACVRK